MSLALQADPGLLGNPAQSVLYHVVAAELENFLQGQRLQDRHVPRFVERELRSFLECGILAHGFLRVHCDACRLDRLVPSPRFNLVRYHGILAPSAAWRPLVVPEVQACDASTHRDCPAAHHDAANAKEKWDCRPRNYSWSQLLHRVFEFDVLKCPRCGGRMRILAAINPPGAIHKILDCLGLPTRPPPISRAMSTAGSDFF